MKRSEDSRRETLRRVSCFSYFFVSHLEESAFATLRETFVIWTERSTWPAVRASLKLGLFGFIDRTTRSTAEPVIEHPARDADRKVNVIDNSSETERSYARMKIFASLKFVFDWTDCWIELMNRFLVRRQLRVRRFKKIPLIGMIINRTLFCLKGRKLQNIIQRF